MPPTLPSGMVVPAHMPHISLCNCHVYILRPNLIMQTPFSNALLKWISSHFDMSFTEVAEDTIDNKAALVQIMSWCRIGDKP